MNPPFQIAAEQKSWRTNFTRTLVKWFGCLVLLLTFCVEVHESNAQSNQSQPTILEPAFRSMFNYSLIVTNAVFEKDLFLANVPLQARKQVFYLKFEQNNYLLGTLKNIDSTNYYVIGGHFATTSWEVNPSYLMIYDSKINNPTNSPPVLDSDNVMKMTANLFLNLGITEMVRGSAIWAKDKNRFTAQSTDGENIIVDFEGDYNTPSEAVIKNAKGEEYAYVRYKYNSNFFDARIPNEFTRFHSGAPSEEVGKMFSVRIKKLGLSTRHIPLSELDPQKAFNFARVVFYSNNVLYWKGHNQARGPQRVLSAEEAAKILPTNIADTKEGMALRIAVLAFLVFSGIGMVALMLKLRAYP